MTAVGTDIFYGAVTKTAGGWRHLKHGTVHHGIAFWLAVGSVPSAIAGVWLIEVLQRSYGEDEVNQLVLGMVGAALLVVGIATLMRGALLRDVIPERYAMHLYRRHIITAVVTGATTGFVIGLTSAGSGTLIAIVLIAVFRLTPQRVVGTDVFHAAMLLWAAGLAHWVGGNVDFGPRRQHPGRLDPRRADREPSFAVTGAARPAPQRPRDRPDRVVDHPAHQGAAAEAVADPVARPSPP